jgi:periplasmic protein TonB
MNKLFAITILPLMITVPSFATNGNGTPNNSFVETPFTVREVVAQFPGGDFALQAYVKNHINYPVIAKQQGIEGKVIVSLEVDETGKLTHIEVIQGIGGGCEEEVIRVLTEMPDWNPTTQAGHNIKAKKIFSFNFQL